MLRLYLSLLLAVSFGYMAAQVDLDQVHRFPDTEILSTVIIKKMVEGPFGFVWIATSDGLYRFDGTRLRLMYNGNFEDIDIDEVNSQLVFTGRDSLILYEVSGTQSEIIPRDSLIEGDHMLQTTQILSDSVYLIGSSFGLTNYNIFDGSFRSHQLIGPDGIPDHVILAERDPSDEGIVWVGTKGGLYEYDLATGSSQRHWLQHQTEHTELALNVLDALYVHPEGTIYWGSWGAGLAIYSPSTGEYDHIPGALTSDKSTHVYAIVPESDSSIWISTTNGVIKIDPRTREMESHTTSTNLSDPVLDLGPILIDRLGRYWIGYVNGLRFADPERSSIEIFDCPLMTDNRLYITRSVTYNENKDLLHIVVDFGEGLYTYDLSDKSWKCHTLPGKDPDQELRVWDAQWSNNTLWIPASHNVYYYREGTEDLMEFNASLDSSSFRFRSIAVTSENEIWLNSYIRGIYIAHPSQRELVHYTDVDELSDLKFLSLIEKLHYDRNGDIWLGNKNLLYLYRTETSEYEDLSSIVNDGQPFLSIYDIHEDESGLYLATRSGVYHIRPGSDGQYLSTQLTSISSSSVVTDASGNIWLTNGRGITKIDKLSGTTLQYTTADGLPETGRHGFERIDRLHDGRLFLSGRNIFALFRPDDLLPSTEAPQPYFVSVHVDGIEAKRHGLGLSLNYLELDAGQNSISIDYSTIFYSSRSNVRFRYKLEGVNEHWVETRPGSEGPTYVNLAGGDYKFLVEASASGDNWGSPAIIEITILEYWWQKLWVQLAFITLATALLVFLYRSRMNRIRKENELQLQMADLERRALQAQMNPHFIFNAMNSIQNLIAQSDEKGAMFYLGRFGRLLRSVLDNSNQSYVSLTKELELLENYILLESLRFRDKFEYAINVDSSLDYSDVKVPGFILQPIVENAIQHGLIPKKENGKLTIDIHDKDTFLECMVEDNGVGRSHTARSHKNNGHNSLGLKILKSRLALDKTGETERDVIVIEDLHADDGTPSGTRVTIKLPTET